MLVGCLMRFNKNDPLDCWVTIEKHKKTIKGIVKTGYFKKLPVKDNVVPQYKIYTKQRASMGSVVSIGELNGSMKKELERLKKNKFIELEENILI